MTDSLQVLDIHNYFHSWRFGSISDEIFKKTKENIENPQCSSHSNYTKEIHKKNKKNHDIELHSFGLNASFDTQFYLFILAILTWHLCHKCHLWPKWHNLTLICHLRNGPAMINILKRLYNGLHFECPDIFRIFFLKLKSEAHWGFSVVLFGIYENLIRYK